MQASTDKGLYYEKKFGMSFAKRLKYECDAYLHNCECEEDVTEESKQEYINHLNGLSMQAIEECAASYLFENSFIHYSYSINPKVSTDELQEYYEFLHKQFLELTDVEKDSDNAKDIIKNGMVIDDELFRRKYLNKH